MPKNSEIKLNNKLFYSSFVLPNSGLRSYFDNVRRGQPDEYRTTFAKGSTTEQVLKDWVPYLDQLSDKWPSLLEFENDLAKKVGPLSIMAPLAERMSDIDHYYDDILLSSEPIHPSAIAAVVSEWGSHGGLLVRSTQRTVDLMKKSTNSGSPYFTRRRRVVEKTLPIFLHNGYQTIDGKEFTYAAILGWRGQEGGPTDDDVKQRVVWMFPFAVNIEELRVYQVLIETAQKFNHVPAWVSMEAVDRQVTQLFDTKGRDDLVVCTDFSKFDQHFNGVMQDAAKEILTALFTPNTTTKLWLNNVFPIKYNIPLAFDYGKVRVGKHGMGSGSGGTNADETLAHRALQYESAIEHHQRLNPNSMCLGDDGILSYPGITEKDVMETYTKHGLEMNADKQYSSTQDCTYLRRWHHTDYRVGGVCVGVYSTCRALGRLCEQERYYDPEEWGSKMVALRQLSIIENVKYHPLREQFVDFCMKRDKYRLGIDIPGFLDNIQSEAKKATDLMPDFLGYTKSLQKDADKGISEWWIVKYLKSK